MTPNLFSLALNSISQFFGLFLCPFSEILVSKIVFWDAKVVKDSKIFII